MRRRHFLRRAAVCAAATLVSAPWRAEPRAALPVRRSSRPVRVRGRVSGADGGLGRVGVSDGISVVETSADGSYELVSTVDRQFVQLCLPAGHGIPTHPSGTARCYRPIRPDSRSEAEASFELVPLQRDDDRHYLFLLADPQTQDEQEMGWYHERTVPDVVETNRSLGDVEAFGIACGDIMYDDLALYPDYERSVERMGLPFFQVVGNHDLDRDGVVDEASTRTFSRHFGPRYYSFDRGSVHYVVLDDVFWYGQDYLGYLGTDQLSWLEADLARIEAGRTVVLALHIPVLGSRHRRDGLAKPDERVSVGDRELLFRLLEPYRAHVLAGHMHESEHQFHHGVHEHVAGAVCGAWWSGPVCPDGTPAGYALYEVRGERVSWRYKSTGRPFSHQMRLYPHGADPAAPDEIVANVWDWDPEWTVLWFEDGQRRGAMARRVGRDPLSVELQLGPDKPPRRQWVEPYPVGHLFYAPASRSARRVTVEATDRFGRRYVEQLQPAPATAG